VGSSSPSGLLLGRRARPAVCPRRAAARPQARLGLHDAGPGRSAALARRSGARFVAVAVSVKDVPDPDRLGGQVVTYGIGAGAGWASPARPARALRRKSGSKPIPTSLTLAFPAVSVTGYWSRGRYPIPAAPIKPAGRMADGAGLYPGLMDDGAMSELRVLPDAGRVRRVPRGTKLMVTRRAGRRPARWSSSVRPVT
jgi:hypothetical protein